MPEIRSVVLGVGRLTTSGYWAVAQCPAGLTLLVKTIALTNQLAPGLFLYLYVQRPSSIANPMLIHATLEPQIPTVWESWLVLMPEDVLAIFTAADGALDYWISGTALHGVEDLYVPPVPVRLATGPTPLPSNPLSPPPNAA